LEPHQAILTQLPTGLAGGGGGTIPDSADHILISSSATNNLVLDQNRKISNLTLSSKTIDLNGYSLTVYGTATMTSGTVTNGTFYARGTLAAFNGTLMDCTVDADCGYIRFSGSTFNSTVTATDQGVATGTGAGGCTFNDDVTIIHGGNGTYFTLASTTGDVFNADLTVFNYSSHEVHLSNTSNTQYKGNLMLSSTGTGGITFGNSGGTSTLDSGKTITIGSTGFTNDVLLLKNFTQLGNTAQSLTLTGTAVASFNGSTFNGEITVSSPGILLKNSTFNGMSSFTKTGTSNAQSDGGNVFNGATTISNTGTSGRIRMATVSGDTFNADATFSSTGGQDVQIAYSSDNTFAGNITINSNKVVFNTNTGKVTFTGSNNQTLNGSYNYPFKKLAINKSSGTVTANSTLSIDDSLIFIQGNLITTSTNLLTMKHGSIAHGASNSSFVSGPLKKIGNAAFVFNVGSGSTYRPLTITAPSNTSDAFTAEYYSAGQTLGSTKDTTITFVSDCGYWKLNRNVGSSNITPKFAFDSLHCDYLTVKPVHIALWNGTKWTDKGEAVTESSNKTTSSAMTSYGYFAFAYNLVPGDAPQYPYELSTGSSCTGSDMLFDNDVFWISFKPDSAIVKLTLFNTDVNKWYASIKSMDILSHYLLNEIPVTFEIWNFPCDSLLRNISITYAELDTSQNYTLRIEKYVEGDCDGIKDTTDYYLNACITNCKMSFASVVYFYNNFGELQSHLGVAVSSDVVQPGTANLEIVVPKGDTPLIVSPGVLLTGDYDLRSVAAPLPVGSITTSPTGTLIIAEDNRTAITAGGFVPHDGYIFKMVESSTVQNLRIQGPMPGFQDFNFDRNLCGGIVAINDPGTGIVRIRNCEIYNFSYAGIFVDQDCDEVNINNCQIHHIKGEGGSTSAKGYGIWTKGKSVGTMSTDATLVNIADCIFDECKTAIDIDSDIIDLTVLNNTFGNIFFEETINGHSIKKNYLHPGLNGSSCFYYASCSQPYSCGGPFNITGIAPGDVGIKKSIFYQKTRNGTNISQIGLPYRYNHLLTSTPNVYTIDVSENTFAVGQDAPDALINTLCNKGGYFKLANNYAESCTWNYERLRDVLGNTPGTSNPPRLKHILNNFGYTKGVPVFTSSPQPPEFKLSITNASGEVPGYDSKSPKIPFITEGATVELTCSNGNGSTTQPMSYIIRPHPNNGAFEDDNTSAENNYNLEAIVTAASSGAVTSTFGSSQWNTSNPGLYGIDVAGVQTSTTAVNYQSDWIYQPLVIAPDDNYILSFNIKDSYFRDLNGTVAALGNVFKQVSLNGHVIWRESITDGGDDWEYVRIDIKNDVDPINGNPIFGHIDEGSEINKITFSIAIEDPEYIATSDLRGLFVWVDDVYLKKFGAPNSLLRDGGFEYSTGSSPVTTPSNESDWYFSHQSVLSACNTLDNGPNPPLAVAAKVDVKFTIDDRKSGSQALKLILDGVHGNSGIGCYDYNFITGVGSNHEVVSASVNFDYRDFVGCVDYADLGFTSIGITSPVTTSLPVIDNEKFILDQNIEINTGGVLILNGCEIVVVPNTPPFEIIVNNGGILELNSSSTNPSRIFACGNMWSGIENNNGTVRINAAFTRPTEIKDATIAIESIDGTLKIKNAVFDQNHIALDLKDGGFLNNGPLTDDGLMGIHFKCTGGEILKDPHIGEPSYAHIQLTDVDDIQIGSAGTSNHASYTNTFSDALFGIKATNSQATIINNEFTDFTYVTLNCLECGSSIFFENTDNVVRDLIIGGPFDNSLAYTEYLKNDFGNSLNGIFTRGDHNITFQSNTFNNLYQGIRCNRNFENITIDETNTFSDVKLGVILFNVRGDIVVDGNVFDDLTAETINPSFYGTAITVQNPVSSVRFLPNDVFIINNSISNYRIGIHGINSLMTGITGNSILYTIEEPGNLANYQGGIWLQNCQGAYIAENTIANSILMPYFSFRGIDIENSLNCDINCNAISRIGVGINFSGYCDNS
jgi:hypothetical protein